MTLRWRTGCKPARIGIFQWAVIDVAVPIERLTVEWIRNRRIGRDHPPHRRVIHPAVHVHEAQIVQLLLVGVAPVGVVLERGYRVLAQLVVPSVRSSYRAKYWRRRQLSGALAFLHPTLEALVALS